MVCYWIKCPTCKYNVLFKQSSNLFVTWSCLIIIIWNCFPFPLPLPFYMIFQSLVKGPKIDTTFSWASFSVFSWFKIDILLLSDKSSLTYLSNFWVTFSIWGIGLVVSNFHVYLFLIYELTYICLHMRLTELVSSINFLCFQVLIQIYNI